MMRLPEGFDIAALFADFFHLAAPFVSIALLIACGLVINNLLKKAPR
jgi:hypothetical protein